MRLANSGGEAGNAYLNAFNQAQQNARQNEIARSQGMLAQAKVADDQRKVQQQANLERDWHDYLADPSDETKLATMAIKYPDQYASIKGAWEGLDADHRRTAVTAFSEPLTALVNGRTDLAISRLEAMRDSYGKPTSSVIGQPTGGTAAPTPHQFNGIDQSELGDWIDLLRSGDPKGVNVVRGYLARHIAGADVDGKFTTAMERARKVFGADDGYDPANYVTLNNYLIDKRKPTTPVFEAPTVRTMRNGDGSQSVVTVTRGGATGGSPGAGDTRGLKNNNPANIEDGPFAQRQPGYVGSDGRFAQFASTGDGVRAHETLLDHNYWNQPGATIRSVVSRFAPSADGNDTGSYADFIAKRTGLDPDAPVMSVADRRKVSAAMRTYESRYTSAEAPSLHVLATSTPKPGFTVLSPAEVARVPNLDPKRAWQRSPDGRIVPVGAASRAASGGSPAKPPGTLAAVMAPIYAKVSAGTALTTGEQQALDLYRSRGNRRGNSTGAGQPAPRGGGALAQPKSQAEYDALPSGTIYLNKHNQRMQKK